ncbi:MAG: GDP-mannose 4,6-dehydratase, partial [Candidatus Lokiarchaeota archaeon]|nr:GDP-mannose 4,6-dehydratase [Candidatus Lokiarchaeota archaeon]
MKNILVTGGMGFIGSNFIWHLLKNYPEFKIINVDKLTYAGNPENLKNVETEYSNRYKFHKVDICDFESIDNIYRKNEIDYIVNFAAESHVDRSITNPSLFCETNIFGTISLLNSANKNGVKKFLQVSTDEVYGALTLD